MRRSLAVISAVGLLHLACGKAQDAGEAKPSPAGESHTSAAKAKVVAPPPTTPAAPLPQLAPDRGGATGKPVWATAFGGLLADSPRGVAASGDDVFVVGQFEGDCTFGPLGVKHSNGGTDAFIARLDAKTGVPTWVQTFGGTRDDVARGVAIHGDTVVVVGNFLDELKLGEFTHKAAGSDDLYVAAFDRKGNVQWLWTAGGVDSDGANAIAATPDGGWVVGGSFLGSITIGDQVLTNKGGTDALLIKLAASGEVEWVKQFGGNYDDTILHVAVDLQGSIYIQGQFRDVADWGGKPLKAAGGSDFDIVLAKYDASGNHVWSQRFGSPFDDVAGGVAVDRAGNVTMGGSYDKTISFGDGDEHTAIGESDIFVARFTPAGKLVWANSYGAEREDIGIEIAVDDGGNTTTTGWFQGKVDFGKGGVIESKGNKDAFALKLDPAGKTVWIQTWGDHDHDQGRAIAVDEAGAVYAAGIFRFTLAIGGFSLQSVRADGDRVPKADGYVLKFER